MKDTKLEAYCDAIENEFFRLKGRPGRLSPEDFRRAGEWYRQGLPLHAALQGIASAFAVRAGGRDQGVEEVNGLAYCEAFVSGQRKGPLNR